MEKSRTLPATLQEKRAVIENDEVIKRTSFTYLLKEEVKMRPVCCGLKKGEFGYWTPIYEERPFCVREVDLSQIGEEYITDGINREMGWAISDYLRARAAGHTHREARYYMLWRKGYKE